MHHFLWPSGWLLSDFFDLTNLSKMGKASPFFFIRSLLLTLMVGTKVASVLKISLFFKILSWFFLSFFSCHITIFSKNYFVFLYNSYFLLGCSLICSGNDVSLLISTCFLSVSFFNFIRSEYRADLSWITSWWILFPKVVEVVMYLFLPFGSWLW